jgi:hypothetical protein
MHTSEAGPDFSCAHPRDGGDKVTHGITDQSQNIFEDLRIR